MKRINALINDIAKEKNIKKNIVMLAVEKGFANIISKKFKGKFSIETKVNNLNDCLDVFYWKKVSNKNNNFEIALEDAQKLDPSVVLGETIGIKSNEEFNYSRNEIIQLKNIIFNIIEQEFKKDVRNEFANQIGKLMTGIVKKIHNDGSLMVSFNKINGIIPAKKLIPVYLTNSKEPETFRVNDKLEAILENINSKDGDLEFVFNRNSNEFLYELLKKENPEVEDGVISVKKIVRFPGKKARILVESSIFNEKTMFHHLIGPNGYRVQLLRNEMNGETIQFHTEETLIKNLFENIEDVFIKNNSEKLLILFDEKNIGKVFGSKNSNILTIASLIEKPICGYYQESLNKIKDKFMNFAETLNLPFLEKQSLWNIWNSFDYSKTDPKIKEIILDFEQKYKDLIKYDFYIEPTLPILKPSKEYNAKKVLSIREEFNL